MGIAYLTALLKQAGHDVVQRYAYIDGVEHVLRQYGGGAVDRALECVRDPRSAVLDLYRARTTFEWASSLVPTPDTFSVERNNVRFDSTHFKGRIQELDDILASPEQHIFFGYFLERELPFVESARPHIYGVSISDERQFVSGCILAALVKATFPDVTVVVGGNYWARVPEALRMPAMGRVLRHWDATLCGEGFESMLALAEGQPLAHVPGAVWLDDGVVRTSPGSTTISYDELPTPEFERTSRQWCPDFVPPLYTMSNCPMQCSFCSISAGSDSFLGRPRSMSERRIVEHLIQLGAHRYDINDELLTIPRQLRIGEELRRVGYDATWQCYLTASDRLLDPAVAEQLYAAGCRGVQMGLESLDPEILRQESKTWNHPANYGRILANLANAGIQVHVFIIVGCPNEPINWSVRWLAFLEEYGKHILTIKSGRYRLSRRSPDEALARLGRLSGVRLSAEDQLPLNLNRDQFTYTEHGLSRKRVEAVRDILEEACHRHWAYQVTSCVPWWVNRGRYTLDQLRAMAGELKAAGVPPEQGLTATHLARSFVKLGSAVYDEVGLRLPMQSFEDALGLSRHLSRRGAEAVTVAAR